MDAEDRPRFMADALGLDDLSILTIERTCEHESEKIEWFMVSISGTPEPGRAINWFRYPEPRILA